MKRKLLNIFLSLLILLPLFNFLTYNAQAATTCTLTSAIDKNTNGPIDDSTKNASFSVLYDPPDSFNSVSVLIKYSGSSASPIIDGSKFNKPPMEYTASGNTLSIPSVYFLSKTNYSTSKSDNTWPAGSYDLIIVPAGAKSASNAYCTMNFRVDGFGYCQISYCTDSTCGFDNNYTYSTGGPDVKIGIKVKFKDPDTSDDTTHRHKVELTRVGFGNVVQWEGNNDPTPTTQNLKDGWVLPFNDWVVGGKYSIRVNEHSTGFLGSGYGQTCDTSEPFTVDNKANGGGGVGCTADSDCTDGKICSPPNPDNSNIRECVPYTPGFTPLACDVAPGNNFTCHTALGDFGTNPQNFIQSVLALFLGVAGGILLLLIILNGYKFMTSQGDPEKIKDAREGIIAAISGILLIIFSIAVLQLIAVDILKIPGFS